MKENAYCINCKYCVMGKEHGFCELDYYKELSPMYELESGWCTKWEVIENQVINANQSVKVKLSKDARELLEKQYQELSKLIKEECIPKIDDEGYYHTQLWCLMKDFGHMFQGCYSPILDCKIIIE